MSCTCTAVEDGGVTGERSQPRPAEPSSRA